MRRKKPKRTVGRRRMEKARRILIISVNAGAGHVRAAESLRTAFAQRYPAVSVRHIDALEYTRLVFRRTFPVTYEILAGRLPKVWGLIYRTSERRALKGDIKKVVEWFDRFSAPALVRAAVGFAPQCIICTHYLPAEVCAAARRSGHLKAFLCVAFTDYVVHNMWVHEGIDHYFVATPAMAATLRSRGIRPEAVSVTGIPILPEFARPHLAPQVMRGTLGLRPQAPCLLCAAGGSGLSSVDRTVERLAQWGGDVQVVAVAGRNERLRHGLQHLARRFPGRVVPFGFVSNMHELMAASDIAVTNSGGLTSSECLAMELPMVILRAIPGQEERNAQYLAAKGAAIRARSETDLVRGVRELLSSPKRLALMRAAARRIARPRAATDIAAHVVEAL